VALIKIDIKASYYGINVFYIMQLLFDKAKQIYILWTRWGRIGDFGQYQRTPFPTLMAAQMEFTKLFRQKTGNKWEDVNNYNKLPKRYGLRRISGKTVFKTQNMKQWVSSENETVDLADVFVDFEKHTDLKKSVLSKQELSFIKPLVNSASMIRKAGDFGSENNLLWECLLDRTVLNQMLDVLLRLLKLAKKAEKLEEDKEQLQEFTETRE
jgi:poly [ADP-ribose] polymerase/centrosomal protein CEP128